MIDLSTVERKTFDLFLLRLGKKYFKATLYGRL